MVCNCPRTRRSARSCALGSACGAAIEIQLSRYLFSERPCGDYLFACTPGRDLKGRWMEEPIDYNRQRKACCTASHGMNRGLAKIGNDHRCVRFLQRARVVERLTIDLTDATPRASRSWDEESDLGKPELVHLAGQCQGCPYREATGDTSRKAT